LQPTNGVGRPQPHQKTKCLGDKKSCHDDQSNHHNTCGTCCNHHKSTLAHYRVLTQHTHTHEPSTPKPGAPARAASRNPNTTTSQTQTRAPHRKTTNSERTSTPTTNTTHNQTTNFQLPGGCLGDDKKHYTPHPHTTNPQHTTTKHTSQIQATSAIT